VWQTFIDTDQNPGTGYRGPKLSVGAEFMLETSSLGVAKLYRYNGSGADWSWSQVQTAETEVTFSDPGMHYASFSVSALNGSTRLTSQVHSLDQNYNSLYVSYPIQIDANNTGFVQDLTSFLP
jgi:hypothetical protein